MINELIVKQEQGAISFNFCELEENLKETMELYKEITITEDTVKQGKADVATLRKMKAAIETKRKSVKKDWNKPYEMFELKIKELTRLIDEPILLIDSQLAEFEKKRKAEKRELIRNAYKENIGDAEEYLLLEKIYNSKWENGTYPISDIEKEIKSAADATMLAIDTIRGMNSEAVDEAILMYKSDLSLPNAIAYINNYEARKAKILKREKERKEAEERERLEQEKAEMECTKRERIQKEIEADEQAKAAEQKKIDDIFLETQESGGEEPFLVEPEPFQSAEKKWSKIEIYATNETLKDIINYIKSLGIEVR